MSTAAGFHPGTASRWRWIAILPSRKQPEGLQTSRKFKQIVASIKAIGLIEPLSVGKADKKTGQHILLDGHMRLAALQQLGYTDAPCLIATDDESYTYNNRINRISTIQEHHMLRRAVERGVTPDRLAKALNVDVSQIHKKNQPARRHLRRKRPRC
jgi:ParB-like chromosome segregation protein Spo0J